MGRYDRNRIFTASEMGRLQASKVCVLGCGGLGGYIVEMLSRVGIGELIIVDGDVFDDTNLNRQLFATSENLGKVKVFEAKKRIAIVNPETTIEAVNAYVDSENAKTIIGDADLVVDALDSVPSRLVVQEVCEELGIPFVHGAIAGWFGQVTTIFPGDRTLARLYQNKGDHGIEEELGNPSFTPATIASIEVAEAIKVLLGKEEVLRNRILMIDLLDHEYHVIQVEN